MKENHRVKAFIEIPIFAYQTGEKDISHSTPIPKLEQEITIFWESKQSKQWLEIPEIPSFICS